MTRNVLQPPLIESLQCRLDSLLKSHLCGEQGYVDTVDVRFCQVFCRRKKSGKNPIVPEIERGASLQSVPENN